MTDLLSQEGYKHCDVHVDIDPESGAVRSIGVRKGSAVNVVITHGDTTSVLGGSASGPSVWEHRPQDLNGHGGPHDGA